MATKRITHSIPESARTALLQGLETFGAWPIDVEFRGRYCYIAHAGDPLCRLGYRGRSAIWDLAIYRYSRGTYAALELAPATGTVEQCVKTALGAYNLL
jgi:hypothetical protein